MPEILVNSNRIELVDPIHGKNKSITIDEVSQKLVVKTGNEEWDISGDTDETVAVLARKLNNTISWANQKLLPVVNSNFIAKSATQDIESSSWEYAAGSPSPLYPYVYTIHTTLGVEDLGMLPTEVETTCSVFFSQEDLPNDKLANFCECVFNLANAEFEIYIYASEPVSLHSVNWEIAISRSISTSEVEPLNP